MRKNKKLDKSAYNSLIASGVLWGLSPFIYKQSLLALSIAVFLALRFLIGAIGIYINGHKGFKSLPKTTFVAILLICVLEIIFANFAYSYGIQKTTLLHASLIQLSIPFMVYIFAGFILHEKIHNIVWLGSSVAAIGLLIIMLSGDSSNTTNTSIVGDIALFAQAAATALGIVLGRWFLSHKKATPDQYGFYEYTIAAMFFWVIIIANGSWQTIGSMNASTWAWVFAAGIIVGAIPMGLYYRAVKRLPAERIADSNFVSPVVAIATGIILLNEVVTLNFIVGTSLVLAGLLISHRKIHPVYIAHQLNIQAAKLSYIYRLPKKAYEYIKYT